MPPKGGRGEPPHPPADVKARRQVRDRIHEIRAYIDEARGNTPDDDTGFKVVQHIFKDLYFIRQWPYTGRQVTGMAENWRQRRVGGNYLVYYYVADQGRLIYLIDLRHGSQKPLKPNTIRKYKGEIQ